MKLFTLLFFFLCVITNFSCVHAKPPKTSNPQVVHEVVHVYGWHGQIPAALIKKFEAETGIKVKLDVYDSNEVLEAKLLAGRSGYDVIFPTAWPYAARQIKADLYEPLDLKQLPYYKNIDPKFLKRMAKADPDNGYAIPYTWGLVVFGIKDDLLPDSIPEETRQSWAVLYNPDVLKLYAQKGVTLLEDPLDVFSTFAIYQGRNPHSTSRSELKSKTESLKETRPYIQKFSTSLVAEKLGSGELAAAMHWAGILVNAQNKFKEKNPNKETFRVILPKEGTVMWIDCVAIPKGAPHIENAHKFINFLLDETSAAAITNSVMTVTTIQKSYALLKPEVQSNRALFPPQSYLDITVLTEINSLQFQRMMTRAFASIVTHKK